MNWFQQNKFLGRFLAAFGFATIVTLVFLLHEKSAANDAQTQLESTVNELTRLRRSTPFPSEKNLRQTKAQEENYHNSLVALEAEMTTRMFPKPPLQPNEFQSQLRAAITEVADNAAAARVKLPENFHLGFDEYATSLPNSQAAPRLGRQLRAIKWIANTIVAAHVQSLQTLTRSTLPEEREAPSPAPGAKGRASRGVKPAEANSKIVDSTAVDLAFAGSPTAARRVFNQIAAAKEQTYIIRTLQIRNEVDKGPKRGEAAPVQVTAVPSPRGGATNKRAEPGISLIVGTEQINVAARIEILRFNFPEKPVR